MEVFKVLTEFRFDIAHAVADSRTLQTEVGRISTAADNALLSFQRLSLGIIAQMGLGGGGIIGAFGAAIKSADKFQMSQRQIANIFLSNNLFNGAMAYENSMAAAASSMETMKKAAREFSLPVAEMAQFTKLVGASLISHGLDDSTLKRSIQLSRGFLKSAPTLGIDPTLAQGQLLDAVMGRANMGDTLFQRLMNETSAMKPFAGGVGAKSFNALEPAKRLDVLTKSLFQFGSNAKILDENARSVSAQLQRLTDNLTGMFSVLRPLGKAFLEPVKDLFFQLNTWLEHQGEGVVRSFATILRRLFRSPETAIVNFMQARGAKKDLQGASNILGTTGIVVGIGHLLTMLGASARFAHPAIGAVTAGMVTLFEVMKRMPTDPISRFSQAVLGTTLGLGAMVSLFWRLRAFLAPLLPILGVLARSLGILGFVFLFLQSVTRGAAKAAVSNTKLLAENADKVAAFMARASRALELIMLPINVVVDGLSELFAWMFSFGNSEKFAIGITEVLVSALENIGEGFLAFFGILSGIVSSIFEMVNMVQTLDFSNFMQRMQSSFFEGFDLFVNKWDPKFPEISADAPVSQQITNIDKVEINNQFKENLEPDRIAFTLVDQLKKATMNPTRAAGFGFAGPQVAR